LFLQLYNKIWNHRLSPPKKNSVRTAQHSSKYLVLCQVHALNPKNLGWCWYVWFHGGRLHHCWHHNHNFQAPPMMIPSLWTNVVSCHLTSTMIQRFMGFGVSPALFNNNPKFHKDCMGTAYDLLILKRKCPFYYCICYIELRSCLCNGEIK
jgi:hypothetical protein